jgi:hypothetical protein
MMKKAVYSALKATLAALAFLPVLAGGCKNPTGAGPQQLTGSVTIKGSGIVGEELSVDTGQLGGDGDIVYQWQIRESKDGEYQDFPGGTDDIYTPGDTEIGSYFRVIVTRIGYEGAVISNEVRISPLTLFTLTGTVGIDGDPSIAGELTANIELLDGDGDPDYQWRISETPDALDEEFKNIPGANNKTYVPVPEDLGKYIKVQAGRAGYDGSVSSDAAGPVTLPRLTGSAQINGAPNIDEELTVNIDNLGGAGAVSYQWLISEGWEGPYDKIEGGTGPAYKIIEDDGGYNIKVEVRREGFYGGVESEPVGPVEPPLPPLEGSAGIIGSPEAGIMLSADTRNIQGLGGELSFQWGISGGAAGPFTDIPNATGETYTPVEADEGKYIMVTIRREGYSGGLSAAADGAVKAFGTSGPVQIQGFDLLGLVESEKYTVTVRGASPPPGAGITWAIREQDEVKAGTGVTQEGVLTIAPDEVIAKISLLADVDGEDITGIKEVTINKDPLFFRQSAETVFAGSSSAFSVNAIAFAETAGVSRFVAGGGGGKMAVSLDYGKTWTTITETGFGSSDDINGIASGLVNNDGNFMWLAVGGNGKVARLTNFTAGFSALSHGMSAYTLNAIAYGNSKLDSGTNSMSSPFLIAGRHSTSGAGGTMKGGMSFTAVASSNFGFGTEDNILAIAFGGTKRRDDMYQKGDYPRFAAAGSGGKITYSDDATTTWTAASNTTFGTADNIYGIAFGNGRFVAVGSNGGAAWSEDGLNWTRVSQTGISGDIYAITFGNPAGGEGAAAKFVAAGKGGKMAYSPDGENWTAVSSGVEEDIRSIAFGSSAGGEGVNARFVAGTAGGKILYSNGQIK